MSINWWMDKPRVVYSYDTIFIIIIIILKFISFFWEREGEGGAERKGERIPVSPDEGLKPTTDRPQDHDLSWNQELGT